MIKPILYSFRRCPYAMRARLALTYASISLEHREISLKNKPVHMLSASPKGTVPVLILEGKVIDESLDIMQWALQQQDDNGWLDYTAREKEKIFAFIKKNDEEFKHHLDRYKYPNRYENINAEIHRERAYDFIQLLENQLEQNQFLFSDSASLADMAIFPFVRQFSKVDPAYFSASSYAHTKKWLESLLTSELFNEVMVKHPLYIEK